MAHPRQKIGEAARLRTFRALVLRYYRAHGRHALPWRHTRSPYHILVSELMLQQTQVPRVIPKYREFIRRFPDFRALAKAPLRTVLAAWSGLGYNRRALYLKRIAERVVKDFHGKLPREPEALRQLPGIGPNTAGSIAAFAWNAPTVFIETNIRRGFIHHFFPNRRRVPDQILIPLLTRSLVGQEPRTWYSALMDYGAHLGEALRQVQGRLANPNRRSKRYTKQSRFAGSERELRGNILKLLLKRKVMSARSVSTSLRDTRTARVLRALAKEGMITVRDGQYRISD